MKTISIEDLKKLQTKLEKLQEQADVIQKFVERKLGCDLNEANELTNYENPLKTKNNMKNLNLEIVTPNEGTPYVKIYRASYRNKSTNEILEGKYYTSKEAVLNEVDTYTELLDYFYLFTDTEIVFLR